MLTLDHEKYTPNFFPQTTKIWFEKRFTHSQYNIDNNPCHARVKMLRLRPM